MFPCSIGICEKGANRHGSAMRHRIKVCMCKMAGPRSSQPLAPQPAVMMGSIVKYRLSRSPHCTAPVASFPLCRCPPSPYIPLHRLGARTTIVVILAIASKRPRQSGDFRPLERVIRDAILNNGLQWIVRDIASGERTDDPSASREIARAPYSRIRWKGGWSVVLAAISECG